MMVLSGSTSAGSMLTRASFRISPTRVFERGIEYCTVAAAGEAPESLLCLKEGLFWPLKSSRSVALTGVGIWLPKESSARNLVRGDEDMDPGAHGSVD